MKKRYKDMSEFARETYCRMPTLLIPTTTTGQGRRVKTDKAPGAFTGLKSRKCPQCGKEFYAGSQWGWSIGKRWLCTYSCMRAFERENAERDAREHNGRRIPADDRRRYYEVKIRRAQEALERETDARLRKNINARIRHYEKALERIDKEGGHDTDTDT